MRVLVLNSETIDQLIDVKELVDFMKKIFKLHAQELSTVPQRLTVSIDGNWWGLMYGYLKNLNVCVKIVNVYPENRVRNLPSTQALTLLFKSTDGSLLAIMNGTVLTGWRTAIVSAISVEIVNACVDELSIIGTGTQAHYHLEVFTRLFKINKIYVTSRTRESAEKFVKKCLDKGIDAYVVDLDTCLNRGKTILALTTSKVPVVHGRKVREGVHIISIGAHEPNAREVDDDVFLKVKKILVDYKEGALRETGDLIQPLSKGLIRCEDILEISEVLLKNLKVRENAKEITLYKSVGFALEDLAISQYLYSKVTSFKELNVNYIEL